MIRRKSSVYLPQRAVREAAEVMRRKSQVFLGAVDNPERVIRRRLSTFAPVLEVTEDNTPLSSVCSTPVVHQRDSSLVVTSPEDARDVTDMRKLENKEREPTRRNGTVTPPKLDGIGSRRLHFDV